MNKLLSSFIFFFFFFGFYGPVPTAYTSEAFFSPNGGALLSIIAKIDGSKTALDVAAYQLTSSSICKAILRAHQRGVCCRIIVDRGMESLNSEEIYQLIKAGISVKSDRSHKIFHNKYIVIDDSSLITGSYNFSDNAEMKNAENLIIVNEDSLIQSYISDFNNHWGHSTIFTVKKPRKTMSYVPIYDSHTSSNTFLIRGI
jgi:phosphatidylserine/phosphatidylglycerophosphate/cardiolipin synthase-like enzyme